MQLGGPREVIVLGAGLAGSALTRALARRGWSVTLIDDADTQAGSRQPALAVHPALAPDASPASRLTRIGLRLLEEDARSVRALAPGAHLDVGRARAGTACGWIAQGRFQKMSADRVRQLVQSWPEGPLHAVTAEQAAHLIGVAQRPVDRRPTERQQREALTEQDQIDGLWWSIPSAVDTGQILARWLQEAQVASGVQGGTLRRIEARVHRLARDQEGHWRALSADGETLASAPVAVLCTGARSAELPLLAQPMGVEPEVAEHPARQAAVRSAAGWQCLTGHCSRSQDAVPELQSVVGMQGIGHLLPLRDGHLLRGPRVGSDHAALLPGIEPDASAFEALAPGLRASVRDHLPLVGAWPDLVLLDRQWSSLARNARLPLPRLAGLWTLSALGGRGLLWCLPAAEHLAARLSLEPSVLDARLSDAVDPCRFLRRALRSGAPDLTHALGLA